MVAVLALSSLALAAGNCLPPIADILRWPDSTLIYIVIALAICPIVWLFVVGVGNLKVLYDTYKSHRPTKAKGAGKRESTSEVGPVKTEAQWIRDALPWRIAAAGLLMFGLAYCEMIGYAILQLLILVATI